MEIMEIRSGDSISTSTAREFTSNGCFIVLMCFSVVLQWAGTHKSLGVLLPALKDQFTDHTWLIGTVISITGASSDIGGNVIRLVMSLS